MSNITNENLSDRAYEAMEQLTSHPSGIDRRIQQAVDTNDLDDLRYLVAVAEGILEQEARHEAEDPMIDERAEAIYTGENDVE